MFLEAQQLLTITLAQFNTNRVYDSPNPLAHNIDVEEEHCRLIDVLSVVCTLRQHNMRIDSKGSLVILLKYFYQILVTI